MKTRINTGWFFRRRFLIAACAIAGIGVWLRFLHLSEWTWAMVGYDESRDMLVARHIIQYGEQIRRGPLAAGGLNLLANSPLYYYVLALMWMIGKSPAGMMTIWAFMTASVIAAGYIIGTNIRDRFTGILIALLFAVHPQFTGLAREIGQTHALFIWMCIVFAVLTRPKAFGYIGFFVGSAVVFIALHLHYGFFLFLPLCVTWIWYRWVVGGHRGVGASVYAFLVIEYLIFLWAFLTYKTAPFDQQYFFLSNGGTSVIRIMDTIRTAFGHVSGLVWPGVIQPWAEVLTGILITTSVWLAVRSDKKKEPPPAYFRWFIACSILPIVFAGAYSGAISAAYVMSISVVYVILLAIALRVLFSRNRVMGGFLAFCICLLWISGSVRAAAPEFTTSIYRQNEPVARAIYSDYRTFAPADAAVPSFVLATLSSSPYLVYDGWGTASTWYYLENFFHRRLVGLSDTVANFYPLVAAPKYFYVICDHRYDETGKAICIERFERMRPYVSQKKKLIYTSQTYTVWRYQITDEPTHGGYNVAYPELL